MYNIPFTEKQIALIEKAMLERLENVFMGDVRAVDLATIPVHSFESGPYVTISESDIQEAQAVVRQIRSKTLYIDDIPDERPEPSPSEPEEAS